MADKSRVGRFFIPTFVMVNSFKDVKAIMDEVDVIESSHSKLRDGNEYLGTSDFFEQIEEGYLIPHYIFTLHKDANGDVSVEFADKIPFENLPK